jgi:hypothetical protein
LLLLDFAIGHVLDSTYRGGVVDASHTIVDGVDLVAFLVELQDFQLRPTTVMMLDTAERMRQFEK